MARDDAVEVMEQTAGAAVGGYLPQTVADYSGAVAARNGLGAAALEVVLGAGAWAFGRRQRVIAKIGEGLVGGAVGWASGVLAQHVDAAIQNATADAERAVNAQRRAERVRAMAVQAQAVRAAPVAVDMNNGRPATVYKYPEPEDD